MKKETAHQKIRTEFHLDPKTLHSLTEKPQQTSWTQQYNTNLVHLPGTKKPEVKKAALPPDDPLAKSLAAVRKVPKEKYAFPATSNQDYGWDADQPPAPRPTGPKWWHGLSSTPITQFASYYVQMQGVSAFSKDSNPRK